MAETVGLLPITGLVLLAVLDRRLPPTFWWLALALAVSWIADAVTRHHHAWGWFVSPAYLVTQAALATMAFASLRDVSLVTVVCTVTGVVAVILTQGRGPDVLLHTVAFGTLAGLAFQSQSPVRWVALWAFGVGLLAWWAYRWQWPAWPSSAWLAYQSVRTTGALAFLMLALRESRPQLEVA